MAEIFQPDVVKRGDYAGLGGDTSFMRAPIPDPAQFQLPVPPPVEPMPPDMVRTMGTAQTPTGPRMTQPVEEPSGVLPGILNYFAPGKMLERGLYPALTEQGPAPQLPGRGEMGQMMQRGEDIAMGPDEPTVGPVGAMGPVLFGKRLGTLRKAFKRMRNMKSITPEEYTRSKAVLRHWEKEYPPRARRTLTDVEIARNKREIAEGTAGRYWPERLAHMREQTPIIELPEFMRRVETGPHEGGHHVLETIMDIVGEKPEKFTANFRRLMQESLAVDFPRRQEFFFHYDALGRELDVARKSGILSGKELAKFQTEMLAAYKKAIPHEMFANVYERAIAEFVPGREAVRVGLQAMITTRTKANKLAEQFGMIKRKLSLKLQARVKQEETARTGILEGMQMVGEWTPGFRPELVGKSVPPTAKQKIVSDITKMGGKKSGILDFDVTTTGMPHYNQMIENPEYYRKAKNLKYTVEYMSPGEYMKRVAKGFGSTVEKQYRWSKGDPRLSKYRRAHQKGDKFPMPVLDYSRKSFGQEGRHRTIAAERAGIKKIPVMVVKDARGGK